MQFHGSQLNTIIAKQTVPVDVNDSQGFRCVTLQPAAALDLVARGEYVGIGHKRRIRYIRPLNGAIYGDILRWLEQQRKTCAEGCVWVFHGAHSHPVDSHLNGWSDACKRASDWPPVS